MRKRCGVDTPCLLRIQKSMFQFSISLPEDIVCHCIPNILHDIFCFNAIGPAYASPSCLVTHPSRYYIKMNSWKYQYRPKDLEQIRYSIQAAYDITTYLTPASRCRRFVNGLPVENLNSQSCDRKDWMSLHPDIAFNDKVRVFRGESRCTLGTLSDPTNKSTCTFRPELSG